MAKINRQTTQSDRWYDPRDLADQFSSRDVVQCSCGCTYFEQVTVQQFPKLHNVILGQQVQPSGDLSFYVFRCIKCNEVYEPQVQLMARDSARKAYEDFLDEMERVIPATRTNPELL